MRSVGRWLRAHPLLIFPALVAMAAVALAFLWLAQERVTTANFERIRIGMPQAELHRLLGKPAYQTVELGIVRGPGEYAMNPRSADELLPLGYSYVTREQWSSPELSIIAITNADGEVVCRYRAEGQAGGDWRYTAYLWLSRLFRR